MSGEQQGLIDELRRRFPLFDRIVGQFGENTHDERIPWFFALLLAAASNAFPWSMLFRGSTRRWVRQQSPPFFWRSSDFRKTFRNS